MIPVATTTIRVLRSATDATTDPYDPPAAPAAAVASGVRAVISAPTGRERNIGGTEQAVEFSLNCDPVDLAHTDTVEDEATGIAYQVVWVTQRSGFGLDHTRAGLREIVGVA
jgi:hypothetical protein